MPNQKEPIPMKKILILLLLSPLWAFSQNFDQHIFSVQGDFSESETMTLSWTIGENFTETAYIPNQVITQGFQQSFLKVRKIDIPETESLNVEIFPNPTSGILQMNVRDEKNPVRIEIVDVSGKLIFQNDNYELKNAIDLSNYSAGIYFIRITDFSKTKYSVYDIIKH